MRARSIVLLLLLALALFSCGLGQNPAGSATSEPVISADPDSVRSEPVDGTTDEGSTSEPDRPATTAGPYGTEPVSEPQTEPEPEVGRVSVLAAGDSIVHEGIWMEARQTASLNGSDRTYDFSYLFALVSEQIQSADLAFINQETVMAGESYGYSGYPLFNTPRDLAYDLLDAGFNVVNLATNHMMDKLAAGLKSTIDFWNSLPCTVIGGYYDEADYDTPRVVEVNGLRIAFLAYCYGTNGLAMEPGWSLIIPYLDEDVIRRQTEIAKSVADVVLVSVHWGEDSYQPVTQYQRQYAQIFADCGVDVIIGHHPHLIQPIEWITGKDGNRCLCAFSLGNLFSLMASSRNMVGGFFTFDIVGNREGHTIENVRFNPTVFYYKKTFFGQMIIPFSDYTEALAESHGTQRYGTRNATREELADYIRGIIDAEFLPEGFR